MELVPEGFYRAVVAPVAGEDGSAPVQFGETKEGKPQILVNFEILDGPTKGDLVRRLFGERRVRQALGPPFGREAPEADGAGEAPIRDAPSRRNGLGSDNQIARVALLRGVFHRLVLFESCVSESVSKTLLLLWQMHLFL